MVHVRQFDRLKKEGSHWHWFDAVMVYPEEQDEQTVELLHCRQFGNEFEQASQRQPDK